MITDCLTLGDVCETRGRVGWKGYSVDDLRKEGPLVVGANDITSDNHLDLSNAKHLSREKYEESPEIFIYKNATSLKNDDCFFIFFYINFFNLLFFAKVYSF